MEHHVHTAAAASKPTSKIVGRAGKRNLGEDSAGCNGVETLGSIAFRQIRRDLDAVNDLGWDVAVLERMTDMVEIALHRNYVTAGVEHRRGFARELAQVMRTDIGGVGKGLTDQAQTVGPADVAPVKPQASSPSTTAIELALKILHEHFEQLAALSATLEGRLADECERVRDGGPLLEWRVAQVLNDMLSSTKVQTDIATLLRGRV